MKKKMLQLFILLMFTSFLTAHHTSQLLYLTDVPTAGVLDRGNLKIFSKIYRENGFISGAQIGLFPRFMIGMSYGGENLVGNAEPEWHDKVEFSAKFRLFDESQRMPAIALGYDSQGHGRYYPSGRYDIKSKGFYGVISRNFSVFGSFGIHFGINKSLEDDGDTDLNFYGGFDKSIGQVVTLLCEYDAATNDSEEETSKLFGEGKGYLNAGVNISFSKSLILKVCAYDILQNNPETIGMDRSISIIYFSKF